MGTRNGGGTNWTILIAGAALLLTFASGIWGLINPKGDTERIEKRVTAIEDALSWKYVNRDFLQKDVNFFTSAISELKAGKTDRDVYEQKVVSIENSLRILRERVRDLDHSVNVTYSAKDALQQLQSRISDLERAIREGKTRP